MTHHQFGEMVGDEQSTGVVDAMGSVLIREHKTVAISTLSKDKALPAVALELSGRINKSGDTVGVVYLMSCMDAGQIAGALLDACKRIGGVAVRDFEVGLAESTSG